MNRKRVMKELFKYYGKPCDEETSMKSIGNIMYDIGTGKEKLMEVDINANNRIKNIR